MDLGCDFAEELTFLLWKSFFMHCVLSTLDSNLPCLYSLRSYTNRVAGTLACRGVVFVPRKRRVVLKPGLGAKTFLGMSCSVLVDA